MMDTEASSKEVEDLISGVDDLSFPDEKREDSNKKKEKKKKSSKSKSKNIVPPNMGPPPSMGPPLSAPGKTLSLNSSLNGTLGGGRHSFDNPKGSSEDEFVLEDAEDFHSPVKSPAPKSVDVRPTNGGTSPQSKSEPSTDDADYGSAGALGGQSAQSRARVLAQQRELQMKRRQQAMLGNSSMIRSTEGLPQDSNHTPAMRQFGPRDPVEQQDPYNTSGRSAEGVSDSQEFNQRGPSTRSSYDSSPPSPTGGPAGGRRAPSGPAPITTAPSTFDAPGRLPYDPSYDAPGYDAYPQRTAANTRRAPPETSVYEDNQDDPYAYPPGGGYSPTRGQVPPPQNFMPTGARYPEGSYDGYGGYGYGRGGGFDDRGYPPRGYDDRGYPPGGGYGYGYPPYGRGDGYDRPPNGREGAPGPYDPMSRSDGYTAPGGRGEPTPYDPMSRSGPAPYDQYGRGGPGGYDPRDPYSQPMGRGEPGPYDRPSPGGYGQSYDARPGPREGGGYENRGEAGQFDAAAAKQRKDQDFQAKAVDTTPDVVPVKATVLEATPAPAAEPEPFDIRSLNLDNPTNLRNFLMNPPPREAKVIQCYIKRDKSTFRKMFPEYRVYIKIPTANGGERDLFLMSGKKRTGQKTSNYLISMSEDDLRRTSHNYLGKLRANFVGTEFRIYDNGSNPDDLDGDDAEASSNARQELGVVLYESNVMGSRGPRRMQVGLPRIVEPGQAFQASPNKESMMARFKKRDFTQMVVAYNKPPRWNETVGAFVLNFSGRVTMASVKNFQLITHDDQDAIILQFGRISKAEFTMDFQYPMTPFQAFAITLSSFDSKIACD